MQAIITAGGSLKADSPLFIETGIAKKGLLPIGNKPMIRWIADSLMGADSIDGLVIVGLKSGDFDDSGLPVKYIADQGSIVDNCLAGLDTTLKIDPSTTKAVLCSSDIPLITSKIVDEFVATCLKTPADIHYTVVERKTMEKRFPNSNRTFTTLKGGSYAGGDILMIDEVPVKANRDLVRELTGQRKSFISQAQLVGFSFIFRFLFKLMDLAEAEQRISKVLNIRGKAFDYPSAEVAMDVDKLEQYILVKKELESRE